MPCEFSDGKKRFGSRTAEYKGFQWRQFFRGLFLLSWSWLDPHMFHSQLLYGAREMFPRDLLLVYTTQWRTLL